MDPSRFFTYPTADARQAPDFEFFPEGTEEEWGRLLAYTEMQLFEPGDTVTRAGGTDRALYLLTDGALEVVDRDYRGGPRLLVATTVFGELPFLDGLPHRATLRASAAGELLRLSKESFDSLCAREPRLGQLILFELGRIVSLRFRNAVGGQEPAG